MGGSQKEAKTANVAGNTNNKEQKRDSSRNDCDVPPVEALGVRKRK
jgi:hypothetical protein